MFVHTPKPKRARIHANPQIQLNLVDTHGLTEHWQINIANTIIISTVVLVVSSRRSQRDLLVCSHLATWILLGPLVILALIIIAIIIMVHRASHWAHPHSNSWGNGDEGYYSIMFCKNLLTQTNNANHNRNGTKMQEAGTKSTWWSKCFSTFIFWHLRRCKSQKSNMRIARDIEKEISRCGNLDLGSLVPMAWRVNNKDESLPARYLQQKLATKWMLLCLLACK